ncbi:hypothetical protein [Glycomyces tenuis]|uniref:hypothetical protein n=1 Tax=Glycomyces tenuis TaxID=58116 RepID=UPI000A5E50C4|nr:hypothetical protein [Glycomyces tenuis]
MSIAPESTAKIIEWLDKEDTKGNGRVVAQIAKGTGLKREVVRDVLTALQRDGLATSEGKGATERWRLDLTKATTTAANGSATETVNSDADSDESTEPESTDKEAQTGVDGEGDIGQTREDGEPAETSAALNEPDPGSTEANATDDGEEVKDQNTSSATEPEPDSDDESGTDPESPVAQTDDTAEVASAPVRPSGPIDPEAGFVFNMVPVDSADSGITVGEIVRMTGLKPIRVLKALWGMRMLGLASSTAPFAPDRGRWQLTAGAALPNLGALRMSDAPTRVVCPDCGHDAALTYRPDARGADVKPFDPEAPAPENFEYRSEAAQQRRPEIMFAAMVLDAEGEQLTAVQLAAFTGHPEATVLRALWALRACRLIECTDVHRPDGGRWRSTDHTLDSAHLVRLDDAPEAIGCPTCGQGIATRSAGGGGKTKGVSRAATHDGLPPLPNGALALMVSAWALAAPGLEPAGQGDDPTVRTPSGVFKDIATACQNGAMEEWLAAWAETHADWAEAVSLLSSALKEGQRPRSPGAVKNTLARLALAGEAVARVQGAQYETYRSTAKAENA